MFNLHLCEGSGRNDEKQISRAILTEQFMKVFVSERELTTSNTV